MPIKNKVYTFDENGVMTSQKKAVLSLDWDEDEGTNPLTFEIMPLVYGEYSYGDPILERFENGEWVDCIGDCIEHESVYFESKISFQDCEQEVHIFGFSPKAYIGSEITPGTYRLTLTGINESSGAATEDRIFKIYCIFTVPESTWFDE